MRAIIRNNAKVPTLFSAEGSGKKKADANFLIRSVDPNGKIAFPSHWNKADVRGLLYAQQGKVCAYCGWGLERGNRGDVEHFRPKNKVSNSNHGGYWWLAYDINNYFLSCRTCNSGRKKSNFPLRGKAKHVTFENRNKLSKEARLLLEPAQDSIEDLLTVDWKHDFCPIIPAPGVTPTQKTQIEGTIDFFRLNKDSKLVRDRQKKRDEVISLIDKNMYAEASKHAIKYRPHSLVARQILLDVSPDHLPDPDVEFKWLFTDIIDDLDYVLKLSADPPDKYHRQEIDELLWALTVLTKSPLPGAPLDLMDKIEEIGLGDKIKERSDQLS